jgi:hypothetical protein
LRFFNFIDIYAAQEEGFKMGRGSITIAAMLFLLPFKVVAQPGDATVCNAALAKDITTTFSTQQQDLDFLRLVDKESYMEAKSKGSFGVSVPLADDLLKLSADWDSWKKNRDTYLEKVHFISSSKSQDFRHYEITSPVAYQAWTSCVLAFSRQGTGLFAWKETEDKDNIVVRVAYHTPGNNKRVKFTSVIKRGSEQEAPLPSSAKTITNEQILTFSIPRVTPGGTGKPAPVIATFHAGIFSDYVYSAWADPPPPPTYTETTRDDSLPCVKLFTDFALQGVKIGDTQLIGSMCSAPGMISSVRYDRCEGGPGCGHIWYMPELNLLEPGGRNINVRFRTNHGDTGPILYMTVFFTLRTTTCSGSGCPVDLPSTVLQDCPATGCALPVAPAALSDPAFQPLVLPMTPPGG